MTKKSVLPPIRVWQVKMDNDSAHFFDSLDVAVSFVRAELSMGAVNGTLQSVFMTRSAYVKLADAEDGEEST